MKLNSKKSNSHIYKQSMQTFHTHVRPLAVLAIVVAIVCTTCASGEDSSAGPQTPPCGIVEVTTDEVIAGVQFPKGNYQINVFGMSCEEVMGDEGLFSMFLQLGNNDTLPEPWSYLDGAVGAPKFVKGPGVGFRAERVAD